MSKKNISAIVSGAGWIASLSNSLINNLRGLGVPDAYIHSLALDTPQGQQLVKIIAGDIADAVGITREVLRVVVRNRRLEDRVNDGHYDHSEPEITSDHYNLPSIVEDRESDIFLFGYNREMNLGEVLDSFRFIGFQPADLSDLLAIGEQHPQKQLECPIVAPGTISSDKCHALALTGPNGKRWLTWYSVTMKFPKWFRFAAK